MLKINYEKLATDKLLIELILFDNKKQAIFVHLINKLKKAIWQLKDIFTANFFI